MWELLVWQGKHAQAPVAVAAKPHYFSELDVAKTVRNILKHHPQFFGSEQFLGSLSDGTITALDRAYFCQVRNHATSSAHITVYASVHTDVALSSAWCCPHVLQLEAVTCEF